MSPLRQQVEDNTTSIKLIQQSITYMTQGIDGIRSDVRELKETLNDAYVKKEEYNSLAEKVKSLEDLKNWALRIVIGAIIISLLSLVLIKFNQV